MFDIDGTPADHTARLEHICKLGHTSNPNPRLNAADLPVEAMATVNAIDKANIIASWQEANGLMTDGVWGPETEKTLAVPRCGHPDHRSAGRGTFRDPCKSSGIRFSYDTRKARNLDNDDLDKMNRWVVGAFRALGCPMVEVDRGEAAEIEVYWYPLAGSTIGLAQLTGGSCGRKLFCRLDPNYGSAGVVQNAQLLLHEMGHNIGLEHTRGGVMAPSISRHSSFTGWKESDPSYRTIAKWYGGEPLDPITPPPEEDKSIRLDVDGGLVTAYEPNGDERGQWIPQVELGKLTGLFPWHSV